MSSGFDAGNPFSWDPFNPPNTHQQAPTPRVRAPRTFPEQDRLYRCQRAAIEVVNSLAEVRRQLGKDVPEGFDRLEHRAKDTYTLIRNYLYDYTSTQM